MIFSYVAYEILLILPFKYTILRLELFIFHSCKSPIFGVPLFPYKSFVAVGRAPSVYVSPKYVSQTPVSVRDWGPSVP